MTNNSSALPEQIFLEYKSKIYGYIHSKGVSSSDADDVFSEVIVKATAYAGSYNKEKASLSTWVYLVCRSAVINYLKKQKPERPLPEELASDFDLEQRVNLEEELQELAYQLERLPDRERRIITLRFYKGLGYREIAQAMGLSEVNTRVIYSRAIKGLKERMNCGD